jgi:acid stress-induced BolA-like protein IbaG/YrbA
MPLAVRPRHGQLLPLVRMNPEKVAELIRAGLPGAQVLIQSPDNVHYSATIVAQAFTGKRGIARHQLVYATLGELVGREIHALSIEAFTPDEWASRSA